MTYINSKATGLDCAYVLVKSGKEFTCTNGVQNQSYFDQTSKKVINCSSNKCTLTSAAGYYLDYAQYTDEKIDFIIHCDGNKCTKSNKYSEKTTPTVEFYLNAGLDKSSNPIIFGDKTKYITISGDTTVAYLDYSTLSGESSYSNLIICTTSNKCSSVSFNSGIFLSSANVNKDDNNVIIINQLIECSSSGCTELEDDTIKDYQGSNSNYIYYIDELSKKLIRCGGTTFACELYTDTSNKYYLDYSTPSSSELCLHDISSNISEYVLSNGKSYCGINIISCDSSSKCNFSLIVNESNFIDGDDPVSFQYLKFSFFNNKKKKNNINI